MKISRGDIYDIGSNEKRVGSEQFGKRPAIVVSNDLNNKHSTTLEVVFLTSREKKPLPTHVAIKSTSKMSTALCEQIHTVSIDRLGEKRGRCTAREMWKINRALMTSLGLCFV